MKKVIGIILTVLLFVVLLIGYLDELEQNREMEEENEKITNELEQIKSIPNLDVKARDFAEALYEGSFEEYLTDEKKQELNSVEEAEDSNETSPEQTMDVLVSETKSEENNLKSNVIYEVHYTGVQDDVSEGVIDQRYMLFLLEVLWTKEEDNFKVENFTFEHLNSSAESTNEEIGDSNE